MHASASAADPPILNMSAVIAADKCWCISTNNAGCSTDYMTPESLKLQALMYLSHCRLVLSAPSSDEESAQTESVSRHNQHHSKLSIGRRVNIMAMSCAPDLF